MMKFAAFLLPWMLLVGCNSEETPPEVAVENLEAHYKIDLSDDEVVGFAKSIEESVTNSDGSFFASHFDEAHIYDKALLSLGETEEIRAKKRKEIAATGGFALKLAAEVRNSKSTYTYLNHELLKDRCLINFRMLTPNGIDYHTHTVISTDKGPSIVEMYIAGTGGTFSESIAQMSVASGSDGAAHSTESRQNFDLIYEVDSLIYMQQVDQALEKIAQYPGAMKKQATVKIQIIKCLAALEPTRFREVVDLYQLDDAGLEVKMMQVYTRRGDFKSAIKAVDKLNKEVHGDAYLDMLKANMYSYDQQPEKAIETLEQLPPEMKATPDYLWALVEAYLVQKDHEKAIEQLDNLCANFNFEKAEIEKYYSTSKAEFVASEVFQNWLKEE